MDVKGYTYPDWGSTTYVLKALKIWSEKKRDVDFSRKRCYLRDNLVSEVLHVEDSHVTYKIVWVLIA